MAIHSQPKIQILETIDRIDTLLREMGIVPVLEYRNIRYQLKRNNESFMSITLSPEKISYQKLYPEEKAEMHDQAFDLIEAFIVSV